MLQSKKLPQVCLSTHELWSPSKDMIEAGVGINFISDNRPNVGLRLEIDTTPCLIKFPHEDICFHRRYWVSLKSNNLFIEYFNFYQCYVVEKMKGFLLTKFFIFNRWKNFSWFKKKCFRYVLVVDMNGYQVRIKLTHQQYPLKCIPSHRGRGLHFVRATPKSTKFTVKNQNIFMIFCNIIMNKGKVKFFSLV